MVKVAKKKSMKKTWLSRRWWQREFGIGLTKADAGRCRGPWWLPTWARRWMIVWEDTALDSDDILYLKEQMEAESNAERLRRRTEKKAFAAFKKAASLADSSHSSMIPALRMEPKPRSGIRQQDLLKNIVEVKAKRHHVDVPTQDVAKNTNVQSSSVVQVVEARANSVSRNDHPINSKNAGALLGLTYESSDDESEDLEDAKQGQVVQATVLNHDSG